jgi:putative transposase
VSSPKPGEENHHEGHATQRRADHCDLKQGEAGLATAELCRQHGITEQTYYRWKAKYGGMDSGEAKRLKQLEDENRKLKHVVAELTLDNRALKDVLSKNW